MFVIHYGIYISVYPVSNIHFLGHLTIAQINSTKTRSKLPPTPRIGIRSQSGAGSLCALQRPSSQNQFICERPITCRWQAPAAQPGAQSARCPAQRPSPVVLQCGGVGTFSGHLPRQRKELHPSEQECVVTHAELGRCFIDDQLGRN